MFVFCYVGLTMHATILAHMFSLAESDKITQPLFNNAEQQYPSNKVSVALTLLSMTLFYLKMPNFIQHLPCAWCLKAVHLRALPIGFLVDNNCCFCLFVGIYPKLYNQCTKASFPTLERVRKPMLHFISLQVSCKKCFGNH